MAFLVTSGEAPAGYGYFNLSSIPTSIPSASWQAASSAFWANRTVQSHPVEAISVAVCAQKYVTEPWIVDLINGSIKLVELQSQSVGNLDPTQLNIAIQDCFFGLPFVPLINALYSISEAQLLTLFGFPDGISPPGIPLPPENLTTIMNFAIPSSVQAYLDNFPFGNFTPPSSKLLVPALVLSGELNFICATAALYAILSGALFYLFIRPVAKPFTIRSVLSTTREASISHIHGVSRGRAIVTSMEQQLATIGHNVDDSVAVDQIHKYVGSHYTIVRNDPAINHPFLEIDALQNVATPNPLLERYEHMRTRRSRITWAFTPALGATLVGFGFATW